MTYFALLGPLTRPLHDLLVWVHDTTHLSWAWSIIVLTIIVRVVIFPLYAQQIRSTLAMQRLQPYLKQLQQKHQNDRAALNQATMDFYRDNKVNPLASCLPTLIQIPIFLALYRVLVKFQPPASSSHNFTWLSGFITDIRQHINNQMSAADMHAVTPAVAHNAAWAWWTLLAIYIASQLVSMLTTTTIPNPQQRYVMYAVPFLIAPFLRAMPVGVVLYWITSNVFSIVQYRIVHATADHTKAVVLPADSKGQKKVVGGASANTSGKSPQTEPFPKPGQRPAPKRRNKRRK